MSFGFRSKGQFFILAAVILSAILFSIGVVVNEARVNKEPENFYDISYEVKRESDSVIDYAIYSNFEETENLEDFVNSYAENIKDQDPNANFLFIYGNNESITLKNYGADNADANGKEVNGGGGKTKSRITFGVGGIGTNVNQDYEEFSDDFETTFDSDDIDEEIRIKIKDQEYSFPVTRSKRVIFVIQKSEGEENYVAIR